MSASKQNNNASSRLPLPIGQGLLKNPFKNFMSSSSTSQDSGPASMSTSATSRRSEAKTSGPLRRSTSLRRPRNKDLHDSTGCTGSGEAATGNARPGFTRSGTGGSLERHKRSGSQRRFRDRDLNVKISRSVQTRLTKDPLQAGFNSRYGKIKLLTKM